MSIDVNGVSYDGAYGVKYRGEGQPSTNEVVYVLGLNELLGYEIWGEPTLIVTHREDGDFPTGVVYPDELFRV